MILLAEGRETNQPEPFVKMTEKLLEERVWWWRKDGPDWQFDTEIYTTKSKQADAPSEWKAGSELAAWRYELILRHLRVDEYKMPPYPLLHEAQRLDLLKIFGQHSKPQVVRPIDDIVELDPLTVYGEEQAWHDLRLKVDLLAPDSAIAELVLKEITVARAAKSLSPRKQQEGKRNRSPSWLWPELMDLSHHGLDLKGNHSKLAQARQQAKNAADHLRQLYPNW